MSIAFSTEDWESFSSSSNSLKIEPVAIFLPGRSLSVLTVTPLMLLELLCRIHFREIASLGCVADIGAAREGDDE